MAGEFFIWEGIYNNEHYSVPRKPKCNNKGENGRNYCTGNSRHIIYIFFWDRLDKEELKIEYCPTQMMLTDYFTKPLKGKVFKIFRDVIMGYKPI